MFGRKFPWDDDEELDSDEIEDHDYESYSYDDDDGDAEDDDEDDEQVFANIERIFRQERAKVRACKDIRELRRMHAEYRELAEGNGRVAGRIRARDLMELVDERITDLKAQRMARRRW